jgi:hypothetical protein
MNASDYTGPIRKSMLESSRSGAGPALGLRGRLLNDLIVPPVVNGWGGAVPAESCKIVPCSSVQNTRVPVEPFVSGTPVA